MNGSREIILSADGSSTLKLKEFDECFHSINGALAESLHIFISSGLEFYAGQRDKISLFEMGFGTGLNAYLTLLFAKLHPWLTINYITVEKFPLKEFEYRKLNYPDMVASIPEYRSSAENATEDFVRLFNNLHELPWGSEQNLLPNFSFTKFQTDLLDTEMSSGSVDLIYYDAFSPNTQPELWSTDLFKKLFGWLVPGGILVTYSSKGTVKQALRDSGFLVKRLPGPAGKKHIVRATHP